MYFYSLLKYRVLKNNQKFELANISSSATL